MDRQFRRNSPRISGESNLLIWVVKIGEPVSPNSNTRKLRTGMLADALASRGHEVLWWTSAFDHHQKKMVFDDGERISLGPFISAVALRGMTYRRNISIRRYLDHALIARKFRRWAEAFPPPDLIVAAMPDYQLTAEAVRYGQRHGVPVIVDVRDKWPDFFWETAPRWAVPLLKTLLLRDRRVLATALRDATGLTAVTESWLKWALRYANRERTPRDGVFFLGAPPHEIPCPSEGTDRMIELQKRAEGRFVVSFIGTFSRIHNPLVAIQAAALLRNDPQWAQRVLFVLAGDGPLRKKALHLSEGMNHVVLPGWLNASEINLLLSFTSVGLVPFGLSADLFPNKAFSFFSAGVPVLTSGEGDLRSTVLDGRSGEVFPFNKPADLLTILKRWMTLPTEMENLKANARRIFSERMDARNIYPDFVRHIESFKEKPHDLGPRTI